MKLANPKTILLIDDDLSICDILHDAFEEEGFEVKTLNSSEGIFEFIKDCQPQLILIDYLLPGINGGDICHQLKSSKQTKHIPVIMISAYPKVLHSLGDYGWDEFIEKPFDLWELVEKMNFHIQHSKINAKPFYPTKIA